VLRLGLLLDSENIPKWVEQVIKNLSVCPDISFVVKINCGNTITPPRLFTLFKKIDSNVWPEAVDYSAIHLLKLDVPEVKVSHQGKEFIDFSDDEMNVIRTHQPDLLLHFGTRQIIDSQWQWLRYGIWSIGFGDSRMLANSYSGFWEWYHRKPITRISLFKITGASTGIQQLRELAGRTITISFKRNQNLALSRAAELLVEEVLKLAEAKEDVSIKENEPIKISDQAYPPGFIQVLFSLVRLLFRSSKRIAKDCIFDMGWVIFFDINATQTPSLDFKKFKALIPNRDRFWADPFVISKNGKHYIFMEEFLWKTNKGHITCLVINEKGKLIDSKVILNKPYHLSYPFIFEDHGMLYMIPESTDNKTIDLFECVSFPFEWRFKKTLLSSIHAVDTTVYYQDNRYWLFCGTKQNLSSTVYDELQIFYSDDLLGDHWTPHPKNPVVSDIKTARPAGKVFKLEGFLCRPGQIGVPDYGYGLSLNRITELSENDFSEEVYRTIIPDWRKGVSSVHTLNFSEGMTVTDGVLKRLRMFH